MTSVQHKENSWVQCLKRDKYLYLLLVPGLLFFVLFKYVPMGGLIIAFKDYNIFEGMWKSDWVGLQNFKDVFASHDFWNIFKNTLLISLYKIIFAFPVPIILALLLNEIKNQCFKRVSQTILYLPHFISWVVISGIMLNLLSPTFGVAADVFRFLGKEPINLMASTKHIRSILVLSEIWKESGWGTIIYLAALTQIDPSLYEAAYIDGANKWQQTWNITLPSISGVIVLLLILKIGRLMDMGFEQILVMQNPVTRETIDVFGTYVYRVGLSRAEYSFSSAVELFKSVVALIMVTGADWFSKWIGEEGLL